jgi:DNA-directed RNA polymerase specialized sigma24 family protein
MNARLEVPAKVERDQGMASNAGKEMLELARKVVSSIKDRPSDIDQDDIISHVVEKLAAKWPVQNPQAYARAVATNFIASQVRKKATERKHRATASNALTRKADDEEKTSQGSRLRTLRDPAARKGLLFRATLIRSHLDHYISLLERSESLSDVDLTWIDESYHALFQFEHDTLPLMQFLRSLDHAARVANDHYDSRYDRERAKNARESFARTYPELAKRLDNDEMTEAITGWRRAWFKSAGKHDWPPIMKCLNRFWHRPVNAKNLAATWAKYPHLDRPAKPAIK